MVMPFNPGPSAFWSTARNEPRPAPVGAASSAPTVVAGRAHPARLRANTRRKPFFTRRRVRQIEAAIVGLAFLTAVCVAGVVAFKVVRFAVLGITALSAPGADQSERRAARGVVALPMTVQSGDTLWKLAGRYGSPDEYILKRVDKLARANRISSSARLTPGQRIIVPVENPVEVARIGRLVAAAETDSR